MRDFQTSRVPDPIDQSKPDSRMVREDHRIGRVGRDFEDLPFPFVARRRVFNDAIHRLLASTPGFG